ncbi:MAG: NADH-quinone oxidoreductase subunit A [Bacteroidetes bacterium]|nr:NADH-quinone oxidoreductase subunit A [Bacteroidota bacterium]
MLPEKIYSPSDYIPIIIQSSIVLGFVITAMLLTHLLGPKRKTKQKLLNFECGIEGMGNARSPFSVKYFLIAILFVLFDVEVIFMYPWAVNFRELNILGFVEMLIFSFVLLSGFVYIILKRAFVWEK